MRSRFAFVIVSLYVTMTSHALLKYPRGKNSLWGGTRERDQRPLSLPPLVEDMTNIFEKFHSMCQAYSIANEKSSQILTTLGQEIYWADALFAVEDLCKDIDLNGVPEPSSCTYLPAVENQALRLVAGLAKNYSTDLLKHSNINAYENQIFSPLSSFIYLSMMSYGNEEEYTERSFVRALGLPKNKIKMAKLGFRQYLKYMNNHGIRINTKIFAHEYRWKVDSHFVNVTKQLFNAEFEKIDDDDGYVNNRKINEWVAAKTNGDVTETFEARDTSDPSIVVANTIHLKGIWKYKFNYVPYGLTNFDKNRLFPFPGIEVHGYFQHGQIDSIGARFIEIPYEVPYNMSMYVILPGKVQSKNWKLLRQLRPETLTRMLSNTTEKLFTVRIPKFKIETEVPLHEAFSETCRVNCFPFNPVTNSSKIPESEESFDVIEAKSKIVFEVDLNGQQNGVNMGSGRRKGRVEIFQVDRPFIAIVVIKGQVFMPIFYINLIGRNKLPSRRPQEEEEEEKEEKEEEEEEEEEEEDDDCDDDY